MTDLIDTQKIIPPWYTAALAEVGQHELPENRGPAIERYIREAHCGTVGDPWCAIFANAMLEVSGFKGTRSPAAQSFLHDPNFVRLKGPALAAIVVYWRGARSSAHGHVGFYVGENGSHIYTLGGNEHDQVQIEPLPKDSYSFGLLGYWWPKAFAFPPICSIAMTGPAITRPIKVV